MSRMIVLGSRGMLGREVVAECRRAGLDTVEISRQSTVSFDFPHTNFRQLSLALNLGPEDYVVNCIGWIPQKFIGQDLATQEKEAWLLNSVLPRQISESESEFGFQWVQIGTDCVFDGSVGNYSECAPKTGKDLYAKTKIDGERWCASAALIRCSIVGPNADNSSGLFEWFCRQPENGTVTGYGNHLWNGVTTRAFARLCVGLFQTAVRGSVMQHWKPADEMSKSQLLSLFAKHADRTDVTIRETHELDPVDRTLETRNEYLNSHFWNIAGYESPPTIAQLVHEMAAGLKG